MLDPGVEEDERYGRDAAAGWLECSVSPFIVPRETTIAAPGDVSEVPA